MYNAQRPTVEVINTFLNKSVTPGVNKKKLIYIHVYAYCILKGFYMQYIWLHYTFEQQWIRFTNVRSYRSFTLLLYVACCRLKLMEYRHFPSLRPYNSLFIVIDHLINYHIWVIILSLKWVFFNTSVDISNSN